jgi:hypothetical protein
MIYLSETHRTIYITQNDAEIYKKTKNIDLHVFFRLTIPNHPLIYSV